MKIAIALFTFFLLSIFSRDVVSGAVNKNKTDEVSNAEIEEIAHELEAIYKKYKENGDLFVPEDTINRSGKIFFNLLSPCNTVAVTIGLGDIKCSLSCRLAGQTQGGYCDSGECLCNE